MVLPNKEYILLNKKYKSIEDALKDESEELPVKVLINLIGVEGYLKSLEQQEELEKNYKLIDELGVEGYNNYLKKYREEYIKKLEEENFKLKEELNNNNSSKSKLYVKRKNN